jgi:N-acetylmuramoyl-L-alanine amidase
VKKILTICSISFTILILTGAFTTVGVSKYKVKKVIIDAGHGGKDSGTLGTFLKEKDIALAIALELGKIIKENMSDVEVIYTRKDDKFVELHDRALVANKNGADLFISIHCNSAPNKLVHGTETYVMGLHTSQSNLEVAKRENSVILLEDSYEERYEGFDPNAPESHILFSLYQNVYLGHSLKLAEKIENQFKKRVDRFSRGVKQAGFLVLWKTSMPSVLIEVGFLSNKEEEKYLNDKLGKTYIASGIFRAFREYKEEVESAN